jgi:hypothetical protein
MQGIIFRPIGIALNENLFTLNLWKLVDTII